MTLWFPNEVYMTTFWFQKELGMMSSWDSSEDIVRLSWFIHYVTLRYFSEVKRKVHDHVMVNSNDDLIIWCLEFPTAMLQSDVFKTSFESHIFLSSSDLWHHHDIIMTSNSQLGCLGGSTIGSYHLKPIFNGELQMSAIFGKVRHFKMAAIWKRLEIFHTQTIQLLICLWDTV